MEALAFNSREDWLRWRQRGIGSSDAPIITGDSEYSTPLKLFNKKLEPFPTEHEDNFAAQMGNEAEPKIRALIELKLQRSFKPANLVHPDHEYLRASLDGYSPASDSFIEIKLINKEDWEAGVLPKQYKAQVMHQFLVSGAKKCYFCMYSFAAFKNNRRSLALEGLKIVEVVPDIEYIAELIKAELVFWECVKRRKAPEAGSRDFKTVTGYAALAKRWKAAKAKADKAKEELDAARDALIAMAELKNHPRILCAGLRLTQSPRAGSVDYSRVPQLKGVDLEPYRKQPSLVWTITALTKES